MPKSRELGPGDPDRIGSYRLLRILGEGGQGTVYLAESEAPGRLYALKLLHTRLTADARARERLRREFEAMARVAPFCTAHVIQVDATGDRPYLVSEYIEGRPLSEAVRDGGPRTGGALERLAIGTANALTAIHDAGIIHRDFKPSNVLLTPDGPCVIDFGIAHLLDATSINTSGIVGSPAYMAPEQFSAGPVGPAADMFGWAATMTFAATGRPAFGNDELPVIMYRIMRGEPDLAGVPGPLREILAACLAKDPSARPAAQQIADRLTARGQSRRATVQSRTHPPGSRPRRRRWTALIITAVGATTAVLAGVTLSPLASHDARIQHRPPAALTGQPVAAGPGRTSVLTDKMADGWVRMTITWLQTTKVEVDAEVGYTGPPGMWIRANINVWEHGVFRGWDHCDDTTADPHPQYCTLYFSGKTVNELSLDLCPNRGTASLCRYGGAKWAYSPLS